MPGVTEILAADPVARPGGIRVAPPYTVPLRISKVSEGRAVVLHLAGRLAGDGVPELEKAGEGAGGHLRLDMSELRGVDGEGLDLLRRLVAAGAELVGVSPYLVLLLDAASGGATTARGPGRRRRSAPGLRKAGGRNPPPPAET